MIDTQARNLTPDEFKDYFCIDLDKALRGGDNPSASAEAFIRRETDRLESYIVARLGRSPKDIYGRMTDYQREEYKKALLEQVYYVFKNGEISADSGYDIDKGEVASSGILASKAIAPNARSHLIACGIWNANVWRGGSPCVR